MAVAAALLQDAPRVPAATDGDATYAAFAERYYSRYFARNPQDATDTGVHRYDERLPDMTASEFSAANAEHHADLTALLEIEGGTLSERVRVDAKSLELQIRDYLLQNETIELWRRQPSMYVDVASGAVFGLIVRDFAPLGTRFRDVVARENGIPNLFATAKANLNHVDSTGAEIAGADALGLAAFLNDDVPKAFKGVGDRELQTKFRHSTRAAAESARDFARWVSRFIKHPTGTYAIGAVNYTAMLRYEDAIDLSLDEYLAVGQRALETTRAQMIAVARQIDPHKSVTQILADVSRRHPSGGQLLAASQNDLEQLRAFIIRRDIIALPPERNVRVQETPAFARQVVVAQMLSPGPLEAVATQAYYFVSPPDPRDPPHVQAAYLEEFNDFERPIVSAHEVYPGHFVNFMHNRHLPLSLTEKLAGNSAFAEGWAHYCEQMIVDEGWGNGDPRVRLMQLKEAIWRNGRYVAGVKLHTAGMTVAEAQRFFEKEAFLDPATARIEAKRGTEDPLYGYYTLGKLEILKLRDDYRKKMGSQFTLAGFHAALLQYGDLPLPLLRPLILGADDDGKVL